MLGYYFNERIENPVLKWIAIFLWELIGLSLMMLFFIYDYPFILVAPIILIMFFAILLKIKKCRMNDAENRKYVLKKVNGNTSIVRVD